MSFPARGSAGFTLVLGALLLLSAAWAPPAQAQDAQPSENQKAMHYSLYYESFKNESYQDARSDLNWIIENAPGYPKGDDRNYERKYKLYRGLAEQTSDDAKRRAYLDTAATVLSTAIEQMKEQGLQYEEFEWEILKGQFLEEHASAFSDSSVPLEGTPVSHYRKAFNLAPQEVHPYYIRQVLESYLENNKQKKALTFANKVEQQRGEDAEVQKIVSSIRDDVFSKNPKARIAFLKEQRKAHPDSTAIVQQLFNAYIDRGNVDGASKLAKQLMDSDPSADIIREVAQLRLDDGRPKEALAAYKRLRDTDGASLSAEDHFKMGQAHLQMDQLPKARAQFRKALEKKPDYGRAYIAIGDVYTRAVSECSSGGLSRNDKAVYWAAVDKYEQALDANAAVSSTAKSKIKTYQKYFPTQEDIFYRDDWKKEQSFTIDYGCYSWISETTTVRQAP